MALCDLGLVIVVLGPTPRPPFRASLDRPHAVTALAMESVDEDDQSLDRLLGEIRDPTLGICKGHFLCEIARQRAGTTDGYI